MNPPIIQTWKAHFKEKSFRISLFFTIPFTIISLLLLTTFLQYNETRTGAGFEDPFLKLFSPIDLTWPIFILIYSALLLGVFTLIRKPNKFLLALQTYSILALFRILVMYSLPLDPVADNIIMIDPFVELFGGGETLMRDLFFSGHTSTMFMLCLTAINKKLKNIFLIGTILVGLAVLLQHTHYSVDVFAAPFFAYTSYRIARLTLSKNIITNE